MARSKMPLFRFLTLVSSLALMVMAQTGTGIDTGVLPSDTSPPLFPNTTTTATATSSLATTTLDTSDEGTTMDESTPPTTMPPQDTTPAATTPTVTIGSTEPSTQDDEASITTQPTAQGEQPSDGPLQTTTPDQNEGPTETSTAGEVGEASTSPSASIDAGTDGVTEQTPAPPSSVSTTGISNDIVDQTEATVTTSNVPANGIKEAATATTLTTILDDGTQTTVVFPLPSAPEELEFPAVSTAVRTVNNIPFTYTLTAPTAPLEAAVASTTIVQTLESTTATFVLPLPTAPDTEQDEAVTTAVRTIGNSVHTFTLTAPHPAATPEVQETTLANDQVITFVIPLPTLEGATAAFTTSTVALTTTNADATGTPPIPFHGAAARQITANSFLAPVVAIASGVVLSGLDFIMG